MNPLGARESPASLVAWDPSASGGGVTIHGGQSVPQVEPHMRWILFDWLLDVASPNAMNLHDATLPMCFSIVDQYILVHYPNVLRTQLQLLGKEEPSSPLTPRLFVY